MKIKILLLVFLFNVSIAFAQIDINLLRENYSNFETIQAEITLENPLKNLSANDIKIDNIKVAPLIFSLEENKYFIYFNLPNLQNGTHNLSVSSRFLINNALTDIVSEKEFNIIESNSSLSIKPGILFINKNSLQWHYSIILKNNNQPLDISVDLDSDFLYPVRTNIFLENNEEKNLFIIPKEGSIQDSKLILNYENTYEIPIIILDYKMENDSNTNLEESEKKVSFIVSQSSLTRVLNTDQSISGPIEFKNNLNRNINVKFYLTGDLDKIIKINITQMKLKPNEVNSQYLFINEDKNAKGVYLGELVLEAEGSKEEFTIELDFIEEVNDIETADTEEVEEDSLGDIQNEDFSSELGIGIINLSSPQTQPEKNKSSYLFSILLIIVILLLLLVIFYLSKVKRPPKTFKDYTSSIKR